MLALALVSGGCAGRQPNRILVDGETVFSPPGQRAASYGGTRSRHALQDVEADILRVLQRLSPIPLVSDDRLHAVAGTLLEELGPRYRWPSDDVFEFVLRFHGATEPGVHTSSFESWSPDSLVDYVAENMRDSLSEEPINRRRYNRVGIAVKTVARSSGHWGPRVVIVLAQRYCEIGSLPTRVERGAPLRVDALLLPPFDRPVVIVTFPDGRVTRSPEVAGRHVEATVPTDRNGRLQIEVVGHRDLGPTVLANFPVWVAERPPTYARLTVDDGGREAARTVATTLIRFINEDRVSRGLLPLDVLPALGHVALDRSRDMHEHHYFAHVSPFTADTDELLRRAGYEGPFSENISIGSSARDIHEGLMSSPGHRDAIIDPTINLVGVGVVGFGPAGQRSFMVTELFGRLPRRIDRPQPPQAGPPSPSVSGEAATDGGRASEPGTSVRP